MNQKTPKLMIRKKGHATDLTQKAISLAFAQNSGNPRNLALLAVALGTGLRAKELASMQWGFVLAEDGAVGHTLTLPNWAAKMGGGGVIPLSPRVREALCALRSLYPNASATDPIFVSQKGRQGLTRQSIVNLAKAIWNRAGIDASGHSSRRWFITQAARNISLVGGSLEDCRILARHSSIATTQMYIAENSKAQTDVVSIVGKMLKVA